MAAEFLTCFGSGDGSAAAVLDGDHFVAASDEDNTLRAYAVSGGADIAGRRLKLAKKLALASEADVESAARIGDTIYWIASFGSGRQGGPEPDRQRFFATRIKKNGRLAVVGSRPKKAGRALLAALAEMPALAAYHLLRAAELPAKAEGALCIEGLAANGRGGVVLGLRNPLERDSGRALLVTLDNPAETAAGTQAPELSQVVAVQLGRRGVRDIVARPGGGYLILAGSIDGQRDFALFRWCGDPAHDPEALPADFGALNPEGLALFDDGRLLVLSDDGKEAFNGRGTATDDAGEPRRQFRAMVMPPFD